MRITPIVVFGAVVKGWILLAIALFIYDSYMLKKEVKDARRNNAE